MRTTAASTRPIPLRDLGTLVRVQYPDRPDLALLAALRLLTASGDASEIRVGYAHGALLTRRLRNQLGSAGSAIPDERSGARSMLLVGNPAAPVIVLVSGSELLDVCSSYRLGELDLPARLLCGTHERSRTSADHTLADFPFGLTGVYRIDRVDSPLAASYRLLTQLGPLTRRRLEFDLAQLESSWRQLRDTA